MALSTIVGVVGLAVGLALLWTGRQRLEVSSLMATLLSVVDVAAFIIAIVALGWLGVAIVVAVSLTAILAWSVVLAIKKQSILVNAAVQGADITVDEANSIWDWMREEASFAAVPPLKRAEIVRALASCARSPDEIRAMSVPIAQLSTIFESDPEWLCPRFDRLLRLSGHQAHEAMDVADKLTKGTQLAAASFEDMVEAMVATGADERSDPSSPELDVSDPGGRFREALRAKTEIQIHRDGKRGVRLRGGPMDGWLVLPGAPVLAADWCKTWPPRMVEEHQPGRYQAARSGTSADWVSLG